MEAASQTVPDSAPQEAAEEGPCASCGSTSKQRCGNCGNVFYCKRECQKQDWKQGHKEICKPIKMLEDSTLGRYVIATRNIKAGEIILKEDPLVVGPRQYTVPVCLGCYKAVNGDYRCTKCMWPMCSEECSNNPEHQPECIVGQEIGSLIDIAKFDEANHFYEIILTLRCLTLKKSSPKKYETLHTMESHYEDRKGSEKVIDNELRIVNMLRNYFMMKDFSPDVVDSSVKNIETITGIIDINGFEMKIGNDEFMGIYPTMALLEHSCHPNTYIILNSKDRRQITLKASVSIKKGDHLAFSYTNLIWGTLARREYLKRSKYFMCQCRRCADPNELGTHFSALRCTSCAMGYLYSIAPLDELADWSCNSCDTMMAVSRVKEITFQLGDEVEEILQTPSIAALESFMERVTATTVHPNHFHLFVLKHTLMQCYGREGEFDHRMMGRKEKLCQEIMKIAMVLDPGMGILAVYTSVALYELHVAILTKRSDTMNEQAVRKDIETAKALLRRVIALLEDEVDGAGGGLKKVAQGNLAELEG